MKGNLRAGRGGAEDTIRPAKANLDKPVTANFSLESPLVDVLTWLSRSNGHADPHRRGVARTAGLWSPRRRMSWLIATASRDIDVPADADRHDVPHRRRTRGTSLCTATWPDRYEFEIYPVSDLLAGRFDPKELVARLREQFDGRRRGPKGADWAAIEFDEAGKCLLVVQSTRGTGPPGKHAAAGQAEQPAGTEAGRCQALCAWPCRR